MSRYQPIIDVLIESGNYDKVYFDHDHELKIPYRNIGYLKLNALQEQRGKDRKLQKKEADVCAIKDGKLKIIIEEEQHPTVNKVKNDIEIISKCRYLWIEEDEYPFDADCVLFILLFNNKNEIHEEVIENKGSLKQIVVCKKELFQEKYNQIW